MPNGNTYQRLQVWVASYVLGKETRELRQKYIICARGREPVADQAILMSFHSAQHITDWETMPYTSWAAKPGSGTTE